MSDIIATISPLPTSSNIPTQPIQIPGSKSHTIRALLLAALAEGTSTIFNPLLSGDTYSALHYILAYGLRVEYEGPEINNLHTCAILQHLGVGLRENTAQKISALIVSSKGKQVFINNSINTKNIINLANSGTSLYFASALAALSKTPLSFDGDASLRTRTAAPLLEALTSLGATIKDLNRGCVPYSISGPIHKGSLQIECSTSQYLSALLLVLTLIEGKSTIQAKLAGEFPYIDMTMDWIHKYIRGAKIQNNNYQEFTIEGGGEVRPFEVHIPGDFSSAAFFLGLSAISGKTLHLAGMQPDQTQADMQILELLKTLGCDYQWKTFDQKSNSKFDKSNDRQKNSPIKQLENKQKTSSRQRILEINRDNKELSAGDFDLSNIPDCLPILAVVAAYARGSTRLYNVAHARKKETDRIAIVSKQLFTLGVVSEEFEDGLKIIPNTKRQLLSGEIDSFSDHRLAMAFAIGASRASGPVKIHNADSVSVTFPNFFDKLQKTGLAHYSLIHV